jgi:hypothetical protein
LKTGTIDHEVRLSVRDVLHTGRQMAVSISAEPMEASKDEMAFSDD